MSIEDKDLIARCLEKRRDLTEGDWSKYPSQSEADFIFICLILEFTSDPNQVVRVFRSLPLGQREKGQREDYVRRLVQEALK